MDTNDKRRLLGQVLNGGLSPEAAHERIFPLKVIFFKLMPDGRYKIGHENYLTGAEMEELARRPNTYLHPLADDAGTSDPIC